MAYETSRQHRAEMEAEEERLWEKAEAEARREPATLELRSDSGLKSRGRPETADSQRAVAKATGIPRTIRVDTERHVKVAEMYPFMQGGTRPASSPLRPGRT